MSSLHSVSLSELCSTARSSLKIHSGFVPKPFLSGSIALQRCCVYIAQHSDLVILPNPIFDVIPAFLSELGVQTTFVDEEFFTGAELPLYIEEASNNYGRVSAIFVSPSNPTGLTLTDSMINSVAKAVENADGVLLIDQCFATVHGAKEPPYFSATSEPRFDKHIVLWDTGKTLDINGSKIGFAFVPEPIEKEIQNLCDTIHGEFPGGLVKTLKYSLTQPRFLDHVESLSAMISRNLEELTSRFFDLRVQYSGYGAFALLRPNVEIASTMQLANHMALGLMTSSPFYFELTEHDQFLRIPLTRKHSNFDAGLNKLRLCVGS